MMTLHCLYRTYMIFRKFEKSWTLYLSKNTIISKFLKSIDQQMNICPKQTWHFILNKGMPEKTSQIQTFAFDMVPASSNSTFPYALVTVFCKCTLGSHSWLSETPSVISLSKSEELMRCTSLGRPQQHLKRRFLMVSSKYYGNDYLDRFRN